jgi:hypothetical protein
LRLSCERPATAPAELRLAGLAGRDEVIERGLEVAEKELGDPHGVVARIRCRVARITGSEHALGQGQ